MKKGETFQHNDQVNKLEGPSPPHQSEGVTGPKLEKENCSITSNPAQGVISQGIHSPNRKSRAFYQTTEETRYEEAKATPQTRIDIFESEVRKNELNRARNLEDPSTYDSNNI